MNDNLNIFCPVCRRKAYKNGTTKGKQRYWCDFCKLNFGDTPTHRERAIRETEEIRKEED